MKMKKVAINRDWGGFGLSPIATKLYLKKLGKECFFYKQTKYEHDGGVEEHIKITLEEAEKSHFISVYTKDMGKTFSKHDNAHYWYENFYEGREDKILIEVIEELGEKKASGQLAKIKIVEIPDNMDYVIDDYDGMESIHEKHKVYTWKGKTMNKQLEKTLRVKMGGLGSKEIIDYYFEYMNSKPANENYFRNTKWIIGFGEFIKTKLTKGKEVN